MATLLPSSVLPPPSHHAHPPSCDKRDQQHKEKTKDTASPEKAAPAQEDDDGEVHLFVVDSGASAHATGSLAHLREFTPTPTPTPALLGGAGCYRTRGGTELPAAGAGTIARGDFRLPGVLYVPELGARSTFVSVSQLVASGHLVVFGGGCCYVKNRSDGSIVGKARMHDDDGLYHLEFLRVAPREAHADI